MSAVPLEDGTVEIVPKNSYLRAAELIKHRNVEVETPRSGLKRIHNEGTSVEDIELKNIYAKLRVQLSVPRIERLDGRAKAIWHESKQIAEVVRMDGKFESFGYSEHGKLYLEYFEALFLLESGRLQLEYQSMIVSVEQAYLLLLGEAANEKFNNYLVYSTLTRAGYIVVKHQVNTVATRNEVTKAECIWSLLKHNLGNIAIVPENIKASPLFIETEASMDTIKQQIIGRKSEETSDISLESQPTGFIFDTRKRPAESDNVVVKKKARTANSLIGFLTREAEYIKFQKVFSKFDIVQVQNSTMTNDKQKRRNLKITFDLHLHNDGFKKSMPKLAKFCVIILPESESFPTHDEIANCCKPNIAPLLVISVSESKQIQAFLYHIS
ncbi:uncharacterized protein LOC115632457 [Scaptodrosophila lebanonensis]|uniref:Uncharacterized protein LOC115632457 n=1 Tax=Drosophila lebanonensis TaxID=7225 RepID=A0A6J2UDG5_DROLE|nr:uncharacterized protein LOC115632457 [Scaptodrosophila lebanonensis]